jgi:hypothetical protein
VGYRTDRKLGVVGVACDVSGSAHGHQFWNRLWFCPNNICHRARPRRAVENGVPPVPQILDVQIGTNLTVEEIDFLTKQGLDFCGRPHIAGLSNEGAALRIDVNSYPERINIADSRTLLRSRNGKTIRLRSTITGSHRERIERAEREEMRVISEETVTEGNAFGKRFCVRTHENEENVQTKEYWVQICCFPTCSCQDYYDHHWKRSSFLLCKHLYWVLKNVFGLNIESNLAVIQPVWTVGELKEVLAGQAVIG